MDGSDPVENYRIVRRELEQYSPLLAEKPEIIALSKMDLLPDEKERARAVKDLRAKLKLGRADDVLAVSSAGRLGLRELLETLWQSLHPKGEGVEAGWRA